MLKSNALLWLICGFALFGIPSTSEAQPTVTLTVDDGMAAEAGQETAPGQISKDKLLSIIRQIQD